MQRKSVAERKTAGWCDGATSKMTTGPAAAADSAALRSCSRRGSRGRRRSRFGLSKGTRSAVKSGRALIKSDSPGEIPWPIKSNPRHRMTAPGHLRPHAGCLATTEAGGGPDVTGAKADIVVVRSSFGGKAPTPRGPFLRRHLAPYCSAVDKCLSGYPAPERALPAMLLAQPGFIGIVRLEHSEIPYR